MKKFKIDKNVSKKFVAFALIGTMALTTLTGCGNDNNNANFLDGTILENAKVITFDDGNKDIATICSICSHTEHYHFNSVISDEIFTDKSCPTSSEDFWGNMPLIKYNISNVESIVSYLTTEEIVKAAKEGLTEDDISNIINRIFTKEETTEKVR